MQRKGIHAVQIDFARNAFKFKQNYKAYCQMKKIVKKCNYDFIHCHTSVGGVIGRIVAYSCGIKPVYTAYGFHFFKGAPIKNWILYYPVEKWLSKYTDALITINSEDYKRAREKFYKKTIYVPGVGIILSNRDGH